MCRVNRSAEGVISTLLCLTLTHLENKNTCARILLIDFHSVLNMILPQQSAEKLLLLAVEAAVCRRSTPAKTQGDDKWLQLPATSAINNLQRSSGEVSSSRADRRHQQHRLKKEDLPIPGTLNAFSLTVCPLSLEQSAL